MNKYFLIFLISISLIVYTNSAACSTLTKEDTCKAQKGCSWAAAATCSGDTSCTSANTSKDACEKVYYGDGVVCTFTPQQGETAAACGSDNVCTAVKNPTEATCKAASTKKVCTYAAAGCSGTAEEEKKDDDDSSFGLKSSVLLSLIFLLI